MNTLDPHPASSGDAHDHFPVEHRKMPITILVTVLLALIVAALAWIIG